MTSCKLTVVEGKGGKDRVLWVSAELRDLVGRWMEVRPESAWLFPSRTGSQVHRQSVHRTIVDEELADAYASAWTTNVTWIPYGLVHQGDGMH